MALPSWERKREGERMDLTCQWSLQRVVDLEDLDFDFCLRCLLCLHSPHQCWLCYLDQWVLKKRNGNLSLTLPLSLSPPISFSFLISQSVFWTHLSSAFAVISLTYNTTSFPSLLFFLTFCFTSSLSVQQTRNPTNKMPFYSKQQQLTPPPPKKRKNQKNNKTKPTLPFPRTTSPHDPPPALGCRLHMSSCHINAMLFYSVSLASIADGAKKKGRKQRWVGARAGGMSSPSLLLLLVFICSVFKCLIPYQHFWGVAGRIFLLSLLWDTPPLSKRWQSFLCWNGFFVPTLFLHCYCWIS